VIAIAKLTNEPDNVAYRKGRNIRPFVEHLLMTKCTNFTHCGGIRELMKFQEHLKDYRIVVFGGLLCVDFNFDDQVK
jgi:hypothetical protein